MVQVQHDVLQDAQQHPLRATTTGVGRLHCLVAASSAERRAEFAAAAICAGWNPIECTTVADALLTERRLRMQLALVDLSPGAGSVHPNWPELVECLADRGELLTVVCGGTGEAEEEIWARQLGVWLYLPGAMDPQEAHPLLSEARDIAGRLLAARASALAGSAV